MPFAGVASLGADGATQGPGSLDGVLLPKGVESADLPTALRAATRELHHAVDHHPLLAPLLRSGLDRRHYGQVLRALLWLHQPLQASLAAGIARFGGGYELADRVAWLRADLGFLGVAADLPAEAWQAPVAATPRELAGMLYVVEGSMLGGQVIARQLAASLDLGVGTGASFFNGWGRETPARWQAFWIHADVLTNGGTDEACAAAAGLFESLLPGFDQALAWTGAKCN